MNSAHPAGRESASPVGAAEAGPSAGRARLRAWAYLSRVAEGPCRALVQFIEKTHRGDPVAAARAVRDRVGLPEAVARATHARYAADRSEQDLAVLDALGGRLITRDSAEWPSLRMSRLSLLDTDGSGAAPVALWTVGTLDLELLEARAVAIVGTRAASGYGEHVAAEIAGGLAAEGYLVVSGAAYGIDGAAHRAALGVGGRTVAVLACGVDRAYPAGHAALLRGIAGAGAVLSEYPPGTVPGRHRFLARNRLVAGLSDTTVVVEAGQRSGALNTARWAEGLNKAVLAVPGPVTSAASAGCHRLVRAGTAVLVTGPEEVIAVSGPLGAIASEPGDVPPPSRPTDGLSREQLAVHDALPARGVRGTEQISRESAVPVPAVMAALAILETRGLAARSGGGWKRC